VPPQRHDGLFPSIAEFHALRAAALRAVRGKRSKPGPAGFMARLETEILRLEEELRAGTYRPRGYVAFEITDPKRRVVSAAPFRDRVVHHALCAVIEPIFERGFIADSYANRAGKGSHAAVGRYERFRDRSAHVLRADIFRCFPAIDHEILKRDLRRRIVCERTLRLLDAIIDGSNPQEPVYLHYPGDDLLTPLRRRRGLPIGNLTSQLFANIYLDGLDHFCTEVLRPEGYLRYVDDFALFHDDPAVLAGWRLRIAAYLAGRRLSLHPRKTAIRATAEPGLFLGYVLSPQGRRLPEDNIRRFRNRWRGLRDRIRAGSADEAEAERRIRAWIAHAAHADTWRLRHALFRGGPFDPARKPSSAMVPRDPQRKPGRSPVAVLRRAAAPGTTIRGTAGLPIATTTTPTTGTTISVSGWPAPPRLARAGAFTDAPGAPEGVQDRP
jgi:retron-type reverse transcriptase